MPRDERKELARRLRALADRVGEAASLPAATADAMGKTLAEWERSLASPPETPRDVAGGKGAVPSGAGPIRIWSDGSCAPNPGAGGWGAIVERAGEREELSGASPHSTNNIMEMTAAIEALRRTPPGAEVEVTTDSQYVKNGITRWIRTWKRNGWRKADGGAVLNQELWRELDRLTAERKVEWHWIRGHGGHPENERCDELANQARQGNSA
jgi:ribonuclease HI